MEFADVQKYDKTAIENNCIDGRRRLITRLGYTRKHIHEASVFNIHMHDVCS